MSVLKGKYVTIRKPRKCFGCSEMLNKGDRASIQTNIDMGQIFDITLCSDCQDYVSDNLGSDDFFNEGDLKEFKPKEKPNEG